jgi:hypothetical protein
MPTTVHWPFAADSSGPPEAPTIDPNMLVTPVPAAPSSSKTWLVLLGLLIAGGVGYYA